MISHQFVHQWGPQPPKTSRVKREMWKQTANQIMMTCPSMTNRIEPFTLTGSNSMKIKIMNFLNLINVCVKQVQGYLINVLKILGLLQELHDVTTKNKFLLLDYKNISTILITSQMFLHHLSRKRFFKCEDLHIFLGFYLFVITITTTCHVCYSISMFHYFRHDRWIYNRKKNHL